MWEPKPTADWEASSWSCWEECQPERAPERPREESGGGKVDKGFRSVPVRDLTNGASAREG